MPHDHELLETRAEAKADRAGMVKEIAGFIFGIEKWSPKRVIIVLSLAIAALLGGAIGYQQRQISDVRLEYSAWRDKQSEAITLAVHTATTAVDRNTDAMREQSQTNREQAQTNRETREVLLMMLKTNK